MSASRSSGNGGWASGLTAIRTSNNGLSSPAIRFDESVPQPLQRWMRTHSPSLRTVIAIGSIEARQSDARSPGSSSRWRDQRQFGQWLRCAVPGASVGTSRRQWTQRNEEARFTWEGSPETVLTPTIRVTRSGPGMKRPSSADGPGRCGRSADYERNTLRRRDGTTAAACAGFIAPRLLSRPPALPRRLSLGPPTGYDGPQAPSLARVELGH